MLPSVQDEVYALLRLCYVLLSRIANVDELLREEVPDPNPRVHRNNTAIQPQSLPHQLWDKLSRNRKTFATLLASNQYEHHKELLMLMRLLMWNNQDALGVSVLAMQRSVWFTTPPDLEGLEVTLLSIYAQDVDSYTDARLRLMVEGTAPGLEVGRGLERDLCRHCLLEQIRECHKLNKHWHVLWRFRHLARLVVLGGAVGDVVEQVLQDNLFKEGEFAEEWKSVVGWLIQTARGSSTSTQELLDMATEPYQMILNLYNNQTRPGGRGRGEQEEQ